MPRTARASCADVCYHAMTRGNARATVFHDAADYAQFLGLMHRAGEAVPMRILAWCLMPNHVHLVLRPHADGALGRWMHWLLTTHVARHRLRHGTVGRIWQGRFKAFPVQDDDHLLTVMRYVERNPVRASLVARAADWRWSSLELRGRPSDARVPRLSPSPCPLPDDWRAWVEEPITSAELESVRASARRERPFGDRTWVVGTARQLGLTATLQDAGRPRIDPNELATQSVRLFRRD